MMSDVVFKSGIVGFLIWLLLFSVSTAGLAIAIRCGWILRKRLFINAGSHGEIIPLLKRGYWQGALRGRHGMMNLRQSFAVTTESRGNSFPQMSLQYRNCIPINLRRY